MSSATERTEPASPGGALVSGLGRAFGGALIFALPLLMTMELWDLGFAMERWRIVLLFLTSIPLLMFLSHYSGFEDTWDWREDARDVAIAFGIGLVMTTLVLTLLGVVRSGMSLSVILGKVGIQTIPAALGALLARSQFGRENKENDNEDTVSGELGIMAIGALFLSLNLAPTEEMVLIAHKMSPFHTLVLVPVSLLLMHGFVYATELDPKGPHAPTPWWSAFLRFSVPGYLLSLAVAAYLLWTFGHFDGLALDQAVKVTTVLGLPAAIGAAAARLIL